MQAERTMVAGKARRAKRRQRIDSLAAALILQSWLDAQAFERTESD
ncbi:MAG: Holliday junction resolvase RuvX [Acidobacteriota bacterium]